MAAGSFRDGSWNDHESSNPRRANMDAYSVYSVSVGIEKGNWSISWYGNRLTDERGEIAIGDPGYRGPGGMDDNLGIIRPRSFGVRWAQGF